MAENPKQNLQSTEIMAKLFELDPRRVQQLAKEGILPAASQRPYKGRSYTTVTRIVHMSAAATKTRTSSCAAMLRRDQASRT